VNQKALRYFLIAGLTLVWGTIIYKVVDKLNQNDHTVHEIYKKEKFDYSMPKDSFVLIANYPDPFLPTEDSISAGNNLSHSMNENQVPAKEIIPPKPAFDLNKIQYYGMIANSGNKKRVAIISIGGKDYLAKEKEKIDEVLISRITKEKITVFVNGKKGNIGKRTN
jgi:hypothetical protein